MPSLFPEPSQPRVPVSRTNPQSWITAHCDGGARGNPGPAGYGATLHDESGTLLAELSEFLGIRTNNFAEYSGLLGVLGWAIEHGYQRVRVVSDSELMVKQIQGRFKVKSPDLLPLWTEARHRIAQLDEFQITHALRHKNKDADRLANAAMDRGMGRGMGRETDKNSRQQSDHKPNHQKATPYPSATSALPPTIRGFTRDGVVHFLGETRLPDGVFVKILPE